MTNGNKIDTIPFLRGKAGTEPVASFLGISLVDISPGYAKVKMKITSDYINFNGLVFGGIIMALADEAFAYATNSIMIPNIACQFNIHFFTAPAVGDDLIAECQVIKVGKRICVSEINVTDHKGKMIAKATGTTIPNI